MKPAGNPYHDRQLSLRGVGSNVVFQGNSGVGKTREAQECWLDSGMTTGGVCFALSPVDDVHIGVQSFLQGYRNQLDSERERAGVMFGTSNTARKLDFLRNNVVVSDDANYLFAEIVDYARDKRNARFNDGRPRFALFVNEAANARKESNIQGTLAPLMRNYRGFCVMDAHRSMAFEPAMRATTRVKILWQNSDGTGNDETDDDVKLCGAGFQYSPVMAGLSPEKQWYRGILYTAKGPKRFEYNPSLARRPDEMLLPSLPTILEPRVLRDGTQGHRA